MAQNRILVSFSKKNTDVFELLEEKKKKNIIISDYICECIRFYEQNNNKNESIEDTVKRVVGELILTNNFAVVQQSPESNTTKEEDLIIENEQDEDRSYSSLEEIEDDSAWFMNFDDD